MSELEKEAQTFASKFIFTDSEEQYKAGVQATFEAFKAMYELALDDTIAVWWESRRIGCEAFAEKYGVPVDEPDTQFLEAISKLKEQA